MAKDDNQYINQLIRLYQEDRDYLKKIERESIEAMQTFNQNSQEILGLIKSLSTPKPFWHRNRIIQVSIYTILTIILAGSVWFAVGNNVSIALNLTEWSFTVQPQ